jgi:hypothetical protein
MSTKKRLLRVERILRTAARLEKLAGRPTVSPEQAKKIIRERLLPRHHRALGALNDAFSEYVEIMEIVKGLGRASQDKDLLAYGTRKKKQAQGIYDAALTSFDDNLVEFQKNPNDVYGPG